MSPRESVAQVVLITLGLVVIAIRLGTWESVKEMAAGLVNVGHKAAGFSTKDLFIAIVFGTINVVGGFLVTDRMLEMFKKKEPKEKRS